jgi:hypothetical protein
MKHIFLAFSLLIIVNISYGQLTKGHWLVGGSGRFYSYKNEFSSSTYSNNAKYTQIDLTANIGYFLVDKIAFGLKPTFSSIKGKVTSASGLSTNVQRYWFGPFGRYYFLNPENKANVLLDASYQFGLFNASSQKGKLRTANISAGPVIYFNSSVGIEFLVGYRYELEDVELASKDLKKGFQVSFGLQIHLTK